MPVHLYRTYGRTMKGKSIRIVYPKSQSPEKKSDLSNNSHIRLCESVDSRDDQNEFIRLNNLVEKLLAENQVLTKDLTANQKLLASAISLKNQQDLMINYLKQELEKMNSSKMIQSRSPQKEILSPRNAIDSKKLKQENSNLAEENRKLQSSLTVLLNVNLLQKEQQIDLQNQLDKLNHEITLNKHHRHGLDCIRALKEGKEKLEITIELNDILKLKLRSLEHLYKESLQKMQQLQAQLINQDQLVSENNELKTSNEELKNENKLLDQKMEEIKKGQLDFQSQYIKMKGQFDQINQSKQTNTPSQADQSNINDSKIMKSFIEQLQSQNQDQEKSISQLKLELQQQEEQIGNFQVLINQKSADQDIISQILVELNIENKQKFTQNNENYQLAKMLKKVKQLINEKEDLIGIVKQNQDAMEEMMAEKEQDKQLIRDLNDEIARLTAQLLESQNESALLKESVESILSTQFSPPSGDKISPKCPPANMSKSTRKEQDSSLTKSQRREQADLNVSQKKGEKQLPTSPNQKSVQDKVNDLRKQLEDRSSNIPIEEVMQEIQQAKKLLEGMIRVINKMKEKAQKIRKESAPIDQKEASDPKSPLINANSAFLDLFSGIQANQPKQEIKIGRGKLQIFQSEVGLTKTVIELSCALQNFDQYTQGQTKQPFKQVEPIKYKKQITLIRK